MPTTEVCIIGLGGVGGYFGYKLAHAYTKQEEVNISFIARNPTYQVVRQHGLSLISPEPLTDGPVYPDVILEDVEDLSRVDILLLCVKEYDLEGICRQLIPLIQDITVIIPLMNGVDIYDRIRTIIGNGIILPACVYLASHKKKNGLISHQGKPGEIIVGKDPRSPFVPKGIIELFAKAGISMAYQQAAAPAIWGKFIFIASFGLVSGRYNKSIGQILENLELKDETRSIMMEINSIADSKKIGLPPDIIDLAFEKAGKFPYQTPTSLQLDIQSKKSNNELGLFAGPILRYGKEMNLPVSATQKIYQEILLFLSG